MMNWSILELNDDEQFAQWQKISFFKSLLLGSPLWARQVILVKHDTSLMKNVNNYLGALPTLPTHHFYPSFREQLSSLPRSGLVALCRLFVKRSQHTLQVFCTFQKCRVECSSLHRDLANCTSFRSQGWGKFHERSSSLVERELSNVQYLNRSNSRIIAIQQTLYGSPLTSHF